MWRRWSMRYVLAPAPREPSAGRHQRHHLGLVVPRLHACRCARIRPLRQRLVSTAWIIDELREVVGRKRPDLLPALDSFLDGIDYETVEPGPSEARIADRDDQPILDAAIAGEVDVIVTGDKHFLALGLARPAILSPRAYLDSQSA